MSRTLPRLTWVSVLLHAMQASRSLLAIGNVSYEVPSFHGAFPIPTASDVSQHHPRFAEHAASDAAYQAAINCGKGMAMLTIRLLTNPQLVEDVRKNFDKFVVE